MASAHEIEMANERLLGFTRRFWKLKERADALPAADPEFARRMAQAVVSVGEMESALRSTIAEHGSVVAETPMLAEMWLWFVPNACAHLESLLDDLGAYLATKERGVME